MIVDFPLPTVELSASDVAEAVQDFLRKRGEMEDSGPLRGFRLGNLVRSNLEIARTVGSRQGRLVGSITFELIPTTESE